MRELILALRLLSALSMAAWLFRLIPQILALSRLGYARAWLPLLPFGAEYAFASLSLGDSDGLYVIGHRVPAGAVRWYGLISFGLGLVPVLGWIAAVACRAALGGPCFAWALASLDGLPFEEEGLKGGVAAVFPTIRAIMLIIGLSRNSRRSPR